MRVHPRLVRGRCNRLAGVGFNRCRSSLTGEKMLFLIRGLRLGVWSCTTCRCRGGPLCPPAPGLMGTLRLRRRHQLHGRAVVCPVSEAAADGVDPRGFTCGGRCVPHGRAGIETRPLPGIAHL